MTPLSKDFNPGRRDLLVAAGSVSLAAVLPIASTLVPSVARSARATRARGRTAPTASCRHRSTSTCAT